MPIDITKLTLEEILDLKAQLSAIRFDKVMPVPAQPCRTFLDHYPDAANWDWNKTLQQLADERGISTTTVMKIRNALGRPKLTKIMRLAAEAQDWDWTKTDTELAREKLLEIHEVKKVRAYLKKPQADKTEPLEFNHFPLPTLSERASSWDWKKKDVELALEHGLTRERIRQIRARLGIPKTKYDFQKENAKFMEIFKDVDEINFKECQALFPCTWGKFRNHCAASGKEIKPNPPSPYEGKYGLTHMNWRLPNAVLARIWIGNHSAATQYVATTRYKWMKPPPEFKSRFGHIPEPYLPEVEEEKQKAKKFAEENQTQSISVETAQSV